MLSDFVKDALKLVTGTIIARGLFIAAMPLVSRLYTPDDFTVLAVYLAIVNIVGVFACFQLETGIQIARTDEDATNLLALSVLSAVTISLVAALVCLVLAWPASGLLGDATISGYLLLVPVGILAAAAYSIFQYWCVREKSFGIIARSKVWQVLLGIGTMVGLGSAGVAPLGLLVGNTINASGGAVGLAARALRSSRLTLRKVTRRSMASTLRSYYRYPLFSTPEALANMASLQVSMMLIAAFAGVQAGALFFAIQVMSIPMALVGASVSQVYASRAEQARASGELSSLTFNTISRLLLLAVVPLFVGGMLAAPLFPLVFGEDWVRAGEIVPWMVPWILTQFVSSPISAVALVQNRQATLLALTIFGAVVRIGGVLFAEFILGGSHAEAFSVASFLFYAVNLFVFSRVAGLSYRRRIAPIFLVIFGFVVLYVPSVWLFQGAQ